MIGGDALLRPEYKIYQMTFFVGYPLTLIVFLLISKFYPPEGLGIKENLPGFEEDSSASVAVIEGEAVSKELDESKETSDVKANSAKERV